MKGHAMRDVLYEHELHNRLFPTTPYSLIGVTDVNGDVRLVYTQPYLQDGYRAATQEEIDGYLTGVLGLQKENAYAYGNEDYSVTDVKADTVYVKEAVAKASGVGLWGRVKAGFGWIFLGVVLGVCYGVIHFRVILHLFRTF